MAKAAQPTLDTQDTSATDRYTTKPELDSGPASEQQKTEHAHSVAGPMVQTPYHTPYHKLTDIDINTVLDQYVNGTSIPTLAKTLGVNKSSMSRALRQAAGNEWASAKEQHYETLLDEGLMAIKDAENDCNLARAREAYLRRLEWRASVEVSDRFGDRPKIGIGVSGGNVQVNLVSYSQQSAMQQSVDDED